MGLQATVASTPWANPTIFQHAFRVPMCDTLWGPKKKKWFHILMSYKTLDSNDPLMER